MSRPRLVAVVLLICLSGACTPNGPQPTEILWDTWGVPHIYGVPLFYNLLLDPKEEYPVLHAPPNFWVRYPAGQVLVDHAMSLREEPPIPPGTPDPYEPRR